MEKLGKVSKKKKLRVLFNSNAPWSPSGYGQQMAQILPRMVAEGYETACIAFYGLQGGIINLDGVTYYPVGRSMWGDDAILSHSKHFNPDVVFTLQDIWVLNPQTLKDMANQNIRWIPIVPIDHEPVPPAILQRLKSAYRVVTYAPFGERELKDNGMHSTYIPHTVPTDIFKKRNKIKIRKRLKIPEDHFIFGMVSANKDMPPRKCFQECMEAFAKFHKKHPKSGMYMHSIISTDKGFPIDHFAQSLGISSVIYHPGDYELTHLIQQSDMPDVYNVVDVLLCPSLNEGFGVPIIEAQSCEIPVITNDFTAMRDLVEDGVTGYKTKVASKRFDSFQSYVGVPDVDHLYKLMEKIYKDDLDKMGKAGRKFVVENFDTDLVWNKHWKGFLEKLEKEIYDD